ncbi:PD-(D/E)XK motif protein [Sinorhizobium meliloti]|uniref:PD-(D/E)XK motif protein n=1 Tax=Rhizobium meliloti TaxID=382 RepID=UPI002380AEEF|nr:PD-(D/E)XK motif protein [Sinorhizobium meliloti]MDE3819751.1 PD-(D/E)XK motif protein [Sinorhizobium meliloti]
MTTPQISFDDPFWDWQRFERDYLVSGIPHRIVLRTVPRIELYVDDGELGARFAIAHGFDGQLSAMFPEIHLREIVIHGEKFVEFSTDKHRLFSSFFSLLREITADVIDRAMSPTEAVRAAIDRWEALLAREGLLSDEKQTGLFGELWLLKRLISTMGENALSTWVGPLRQAHDFRIGDNEFEVKTTSSAERKHRINGLGQLSPSLGCKLYILSVRLTNAGTGGETLPELVESLTETLNQWPGATEKFGSLLARIGYDSRDEPLYASRRRLREGPILIPVVDGVPRLTDEAVMSLDPRFSPSRVSHIVYDIDVTGLGYPDGSQIFSDLLPGE